LEETPIRDVLFVQVNPCIRNVKIAAALKSAGINVHLAYVGRTPQETYGFGNAFYASIHDLGNWSFRHIPKIKKLIQRLNISAIHYHNYPDKLGAQMILANLPVPVIYDQHDFFSQKKKLSSRRLYYEKVCNEQADGRIYITEEYKNLVAQKYALDGQYILLPNYALGSIVPEEMNKTSERDGKIHLVYIGLITQHEDKVRNLIDYFSLLSERNFVIHVYPTRSKGYPRYEAIPNVIMHKQLPLDKLVREIAAYDLGILFLNKEVSEMSRVEELRHGAWNKFFDYITAGLPVITFDEFEYMAQIVKENNFGLSVQSIDDITYERIKELDLNHLRQEVKKSRSRFFMEDNIGPLVRFYERVAARFGGNGKKA